MIMLKRKALLLFQKPKGIGPIKPKNPHSVFTFSFEPKITPKKIKNIPTRINPSPQSTNSSFIYLF